MSFIASRYIDSHFLEGVFSFHEDPEDLMKISSSEEPFSIMDIDTL